MRGECVPPLGQGGLRERTKNGQSPREVAGKKIPEPASSGSQVRSDQQQANSDQQQPEENKASNESQGNDDAKKGYGCSASS